MLLLASLLLWTAVEVAAQQVADRCAVGLSDSTTVRLVTDSWAEYRDKFYILAETAGDINGDGAADVVISQRQQVHGWTYVFVLFGGRDSAWAKTPPGTIVNISNLRSPLATHVISKQQSIRVFDARGCGDINGDGIDDLAVSSTISTKPGPIFVVFGRGGRWPAELFADALDLTNHSGVNITTDTMGWALDWRTLAGFAAGDVNGDGVDDFIVTSTSSSNHLTELNGRVFIVLGRKKWPAALDVYSQQPGVFSIDGEDRNCQLGSEVSAIGDTDGDGLSDFVTCCLLVAKCYLVLGRREWTNTNIYLKNISKEDGIVRMVVSTTPSVFWMNLNTAGDINSDGFADIAISLEPKLEWQSMRGEAYVVFGRPREQFPLSLALQDLSGGDDGFVAYSTEDYGLAELVVGASGDFNGDKINDLLVGNTGEWCAEAGFPWNTTGAIFVVFGHPRGYEWPSQVPLEKLDFPNSGAVFGQRDIESDSEEWNPGRVLNGVGDLDGDAVDDILFSGLDTHGTIYFTRGDHAPALKMNCLQVKKGQHVTLTTADISAYTAATFRVSRVMHGRFELQEVGGAVEVTEFASQQVEAGAVSFIHDGSSFSPSYNVSVLFPVWGCWGAELAAHVTFSSGSKQGINPALVIGCSVGGAIACCILVAVVATVISHKMRRRMYQPVNHQVQ